MDPLIGLLVTVLLFCIVGYGLWWICVHFSLPQPVLWIVGVILLIFLLVFLSHQVGLPTAFPVLKTH